MTSEYDRNGVYQMRNPSHDQHCQCASCTALWTQGPNGESVPFDGVQEIASLADYACRVTSELEEARRMVSYLTECEQMTHQKGTRLSALLREVVTDLNIGLPGNLRARLKAALEE